MVPFIEYSTYPNCSISWTCIKSKKSSTYLNLRRPRNLRILRFESTAAIFWNVTVVFMFSLLDSNRILLFILVSLLFYFTTQQNYLVTFKRTTKLSCYNYLYNFLFTFWQINLQDTIRIIAIAQARI